jgi:hypothetical protein
MAIETDTYAPCAIGEAARQWDRRGSRGTGRQEQINEAPSDLGELPEYFWSLAPTVLASCWVACTIDAAMLAGLDVRETGALARTLTVVAEKLHGAVEDGVLPKGWSKEFIMPGYNDPADKYAARKVQQERAETEAERLRREMQAQTDAEQAGFSVGTGTPPPPARSSKASPLYQRMLALEVGQFIVVTKTKYKPSAVQNMLTAAKKERPGAKLRKYAIASGDLVVIRDPDGRGAA